jgi:hypothetical protein
MEYMYLHVGIWTSQLRCSVLSMAQSLGRNVRRTSKSSTQRCTADTCCKQAFSADMVFNVINQ